MRRPRFYLAPGCAVKGCASLGGSDFHHLRHVLRMGIGDRLDLFDGRGWEMEGRIRCFRPGAVEIEIGPRKKGKREPGVDITIAQLVPRLSKMDLVVAKCAEIGVRRIIPVAEGRSVRRWEAGQGEKHRERWQRISIEATSQSGGTVVPEITAPRSFAESLAILGKLDVPVILWEKGKTPLWLLLKAEGKKETIGIMVGPEGGFGEEDVKEAQIRGLRPVSLGKRILRSETAAIVASHLSAHWGGR